jgi:hypothetical protein
VGDPSCVGVCYLPGRCRPRLPPRQPLELGEICRPRRTVGRHLPPASVVSPPVPSGAKQGGEAASGRPERLEGLPEAFPGMPRGTGLRRLSGGAGRQQRHRPGAFSSPGGRGRDSRSRCGSVAVRKGVCPWPRPAPPPRAQTCRRRRRRPGQRPETPTGRLPSSIAPRKVSSGEAGASLRAVAS